MELKVIVGARSKSTSLHAHLFGMLFEQLYFIDRGWVQHCSLTQTHMNGPQVTLTNGQTNNFPYTKLFFVYSLYSSDGLLHIRSKAVKRRNIIIYQRTIKIEWICNRIYEGN